MKWTRRASPPSALTRRQIGAAYSVAIVTDIAQLVLGPIGWAFSDEVLDVIAMAILWRMLGFHPLLLPTFVLELAPVADLLPTWTACVALIVMLRRREAMRPVPPEDHGPVIDV